jgi:hypothetical protein
MISVNFTAMAVLLQIDFLEPHENSTKAIAWLFTSVTWFLVYHFRNK